MYGATASKYFVGHNTDVAESITMQGQDLNHYSENSVNKYFRFIFNTKEHYDKVIYVPIISYAEKYTLKDTEIFFKNDKKEWIPVNMNVDESIIKNKQFTEDAEKKLKKIFVKTTFGKYLGITFEQAQSIDINKGRITEQKPLTNPQFKENFKYFGKDSYLEDDPAVSLTIAGDTDSCSSDTLIYVNGEKMTIEEAFKKMKYANNDFVIRLDHGQEVIPANGFTTKAFNPIAMLLPAEKPINYIMRHKVSKGKFRIKSKSGKEVIVTEDHSCMVIRNNKLIEIKAKDINIKTDRLVEIV